MNRLKNTILFVALAIPLESGHWQSLSYSNIANHKLEFNKNELVIDVKKSAQPLIFTLKSKPMVSSICIEGEKYGSIDFKKPTEQGQKGKDDFAIRFGLVESGSETLNWFQKKIAADWILKLFSLADKNEGIHKIHFYTAVQDATLLGKSRKHPLGKGLMLEKNVWLLKKTQDKFKFQYKLEKSLKSLALWLSVDGDDTESSYQLKIQSIKLNCID